MKWVTDQPAWKRSEGRDHILPVHHPWSFKSVRRFMKNAIWLLPDMDSTGNWLLSELVVLIQYLFMVHLFYDGAQNQCQLLKLIMLRTHRYKPGQVWLEKDLILPYVPNVEVCDAKCMSESGSQRNTLLFFRGRLKRNAVRMFSFFFLKDNLFIFHMCLMHISYYFWPV